MRDNLILILQITMTTQTKSQLHLVEQVSLDTKVDEYAFQTWEHHKWATRPNPHLNGMTYWEQSKQTRRAASRFGYHGRYDCGHIWPKNVISTNMMNSYYDGNKKNMLGSLHETSITGDIYNGQSTSFRNLYWFQIIIFKCYETIWCH